MKRIAGSPMMWSDALAAIAHTELCERECEVAVWGEVSLHYDPHVGWFIDIPFHRHELDREIVAALHLAFHAPSHE